MKTGHSRKLFFMIVVGTFYLFSESLGISEERAATKVMKGKGMIVTVSAETGTVVIEDELENVRSLTVEGWIDLLSFNSNDKVTFEYNSQGVIISMSKIK